MFSNLEIKHFKFHNIKEFIRGNFTSIFYTGSSGITSIAQLASSIVVLKFVDPTELGIWNSVKYLSVYSFIILIGINNGLNRELPFSLGQNNFSLANKKAAVALYYNILTSFLIIIMGIVALLILKSRIEFNLLLAFLTIIPFIIINHYNNYLTVTYRSKDSFNNLSYIKISESIIMIVSLYIVVSYGYKGMLIRSLLVLLIVTILMHVNRPLRVIPEWSKSEFIVLLKTGVPIFAIDYVKNISSTIAPIIVLSSGGFEMVGLFTLGTMAFSTMGVIPSSISQYVYPKLSFSYGKYNRPLDLWKLSMRSLLLCYSMLIPAVIVAIIFIDPLIKNYFPKYLGGVLAAKIFIISSIFNSISILSNVLLSIKHFKMLYFTQIIFSFLLIILPIFGVMLFADPTVGASIGILFANVANCIIVICAVYNSTHRITLQ